MSGLASVLPLGLSRPRDGLVRVSRLERIGQRSLYPPHKGRWPTSTVVPVERTAHPATQPTRVSGLSVVVRSGSLSAQRTGRNSMSFGKASRKVVMAAKRRGKA